VLYALDVRSLLLLLAGQTTAPDMLTATANALERGGLYAVVSILLGAVGTLFWLKEKEREKLHAEFQTLQNGFQKELLRLIEAQTAVITRQAILTEKVESLLIRVTTRLERKED
jgi:hypothetical protein